MARRESTYDYVNSKNNTDKRKRTFWSVQRFVEVEESTVKGAYYHMRINGAEFNYQNTGVITYDTSKREAIKLLNDPK